MAYGLYDGSLESIPGLGGMLQQQKINQQADSSKILQARESLGILEHLRAQQQDAQLKQVLAQSGGDLSKASQVLIQTGNIAAAAKLAPLLKLQQDQMASQAISGAAQMTPDQLDVLGQNLAAHGHPGAATVMSIADKRRGKANNDATLATMRETPQGLDSGQTVPGSTQVVEPGQSVPPEDMAAFLKVAQSKGPMTATPQEGDAPTMGGGVLSALAESKAPAIAQRARYLQNLINSPDFKGDLTAIQRETDNLTRMEQTFQAQQNKPKPAEPLEKVMGPNGPILTPRSQASGMTPAPTSSVAGSGTMDPETLKMTAQQYLAGDRQAVQGFARSATARIALQNAVMEEAKAQGLTGPAIAAKMADFAGIMAGSRTVGTRAAQIELASNEATKMMDIVSQQSAKFGRTNFIPFNKALRAFETQTGQPEVKAFGAAINSLVNVYARAINPSGVATDSDKNHARQILENIDSPDQVQAVLDVMRQEMNAAQAAPADVRNATRNAVTGGTSAPANIEDILKKYRK